MDFLGNKVVKAKVTVLNIAKSGPKRPGTMTNYRIVFDM